MQILFKDEIRIAPDLKQVGPNGEFYTVEHKKTNEIDCYILKK